MSQGVSQLEEWSCFESGGTPADASVSPARYQQGEHTVAGVAVVF